MLQVPKRDNHIFSISLQAAKGNFIYLLNTISTIYIKISMNNIEFYDAWLKLFTYTFKIQIKRYI